LIPAGSVLIVVRSGILKHSLPVGINRVPVAINQDLKALVCGPKVDADYLARFLQSSAPRLLGQARATTADNLPLDLLTRFPIPLPPLAEQRRIAAILDKADALRRKRADALCLTDDFLRSAFLDMFGDPVTNPKGWPVASVGSISVVQGGLQVTSARESLPLGVPYLRVANVYRDRLELHEVKTLRVTPSELARAALSSGDILVVEGHGNREEIGRSAVWDGSISPCVHQNHLIRVRTAHDQAEPCYISAFINSAGGRRQLFQSGKTTSGLNTISTSNVKAVRVALPPIDAQRQYVSIVRRATHTAQNLSANFVASDHLFHSLVQRAFRGEL
jgi:type I restriction enzyme S subunit